MPFKSSLSCGTLSVTVNDGRLGNRRFRAIPGRLVAGLEDECPIPLAWPGPAAPDVTITR